MKIKLILALSLLVASPAVAAPTLIEVAKGSSNDITVPAGSVGGEYDFAYMSTGKTAAMVKASLVAPKGTTLTIRTVGVPVGTSVAAAYGYLKSAYPVEIAPYGGKFKRSHAVGSPAGATKIKSPSGKYTCGGRLLSSFKNYFSGIYKNAYGSLPANDDALCTFLFSDYVAGGDNQAPPVSNSNVLSVSGRLLKDLCSKKSYDYLVVASVNLNKAPAAELAAGFTLSIDLDEYVSKSRAEWSIKPVSDGKFAPHPLLLVDTLSGMSDQAVIAKFKSGNISTLQSVSTLQAKKVAPWRSHALASYLVGSLLRGGKASLFNSSNTELTAPGCMTLVRKRQSSRGYGR